MSKITVDQKRLETLKRQIYGKEIHYSSKLSSAPLSSEQKKDTIYLKADLIKITALSTLAIAFQFALYFGIQNHLIKLPI